MIGFVIPIKPRRFSRDWKHENELLSRTLGSILQQTDQRFKVFIVYTDKPEISFDDHRFHWISFGYHFCLSHEIDDYEPFVKKWHNPDYAAKMFDKGRKITLGCINARKEACKYIMAVDSDDLISNRIASFVNTSPAGCTGWVIRNGYMYLDGTSWLLRKRDIQNINGTTHIVREDLVPIPNMESKRFFDFSFFEAHGYLCQRLFVEKGVQLESLPFYGVIYTIHENNTSAIRNVLSLTKLKTIVKYTLFGRRLTSRLKSEFNIVNL